MQRLWKCALVVLTGLSVVLPETVTVAKDAEVTQARKPALRVQDVSLDDDGTLRGVVVDGQGRPQPSTAVSIRQGRRHTVTVRTSDRGRFEVRGLKGGVYQVSSPEGASLLRVWKHGTAPKQASRLALVVNDSNVVRGQLITGIPFLGGGVSLPTIAIAGGVIAGTTVAIVEATDDDDKSN